jgi:hypothetical protein
MLNLLSHKVERPLTSLQTDGDLACQTDQKFLNWVSKTQAEFWLHLCLAKVIFFRLLVNILCEGEYLFFSESVRILQRYVNMVQLMDRNDRTYWCSNKWYQERTWFQSWLGFRLSWLRVLVVFRSIRKEYSDGTLIFVIWLMKYFHIAHWYQRLFIPVDDISYVIGERCASVWKSLGKDKRQGRSVFVMKAYMGRWRMAPLILKLGTR